MTVRDERATSSGVKLFIAARSELTRRRFAAGGFANQERPVIRETASGRSAFINTARVYMHNDLASGKRVLLPRRLAASRRGNEPDALQS